MSFRKCFLLGVAVVLLACAGSARAQFAVYGTVTGERLGTITCLDPQGTCASNDGKVRPYGGSFGGYYDFKSYGPARLGVDVRGEVTNADKRADYYSASTDFVRHYAAMGGLRASFKTPFRVLSPYAQVSAVYARSNLEGGYKTFTQVKGFVGLDLKVFPILDIRAMELGAGEMFGSKNYNIQSIGAGLVFHLPR